MTRTFGQLKTALLALTLILAYARVAPLFYGTWMTEDYSHGFFVPLVSAYMVWVDREKLGRIVPEPNFVLGVPLLSLSAFMLVYGTFATITALQQYSVFLLVPGLIVLVMGIKWLRAVLLPVAYLLLMFPIPGPVIGHIHWPLQLITSVVSSSVLSLVGIPVFRHEQFMELANQTLEVAPECSGLQFLIAMLAIGVPLAHLTQRKAWKKAALVASAVALGLFANWLRVFIAGLWVYYTGQESHGFIHILKGMLVSVAGFFILFAEARLLNWKDAASPEPAAPSAGKPFLQVSGKGAMAATVFFAILSGFLFLRQPVRVQLQTSGPQQALPSISGWQASPVAEHKEPFKLSGADTDITTEYRTPDGQTVYTYIGYLESQNDTKELVNAGMNRFQEKYETVPLMLEDGTRTLVNRRTISSGPDKYLLHFWYSINGRPVADRMMAKHYSAMDGIVSGRNNGAVVMVFSKMDLPEADHERFLARLHPAVNSWLSGSGTARTGGAQ